MTKATLLTLALLCLSSASFAAEKPNFVIIFTDDQGYGDLGCFGGTIETPRIDQMATEGMRLTSFYVAAPVCTPSRAALMTGCYPKRIDMATGSRLGVLLDADSKGLNPNEITIAEVLKAAGYRTGIFGKWHLGDQPEFLPTRQGFDEFFGMPYSWDIHPTHPNRKYHFSPLPLLDGETVIELDPDLDTMTGRITERAVAFIEANKDRPFFLYLAEFLPHRPLHVAPPFMKNVPQSIKDQLAAEVRSHAPDNNKVRDELYPNAIAEIDWSVGQVLDTLKRLGLDDNTLVFFTSDNGPVGNGKGSAGPLRGSKGNTYEGGMRVPAVVRWPGHIPAGRVNDELITAMDLLPTFARLAGARVPTDRVIDGKDVWPVLTEEAPSPHDALFYYREDTLECVRMGPWKLRVEAGNPVALYNLDDDIGERNNVLSAHPDIAEQLLARIEQFTDDIAEHSRPAGYVENPKPLSARRANGGFR